MVGDTGHRDLITVRLPELCTEFGVPGASAAVIADDETITATAGVLNTRTGLAVTPESIFQIQSITKVWTATLVMQLVDDDRVDLGDPVVAHVPDFRTADPEVSARITVRQLLTHTGGFEGDDWRSTIDDDTALERFVTDLVSRAPQHLPPGERFSYCSAGMAVLGRLVEIHRELPFRLALRRYLAEPLGLTDLAINAAEALGFRAAIGHVDGRPLRSWSYMPESNHPAGAQLSMSAASLAAFGRAHCGDGSIADGRRVLSGDAVLAMRRPHVPVPGGISRRGLGWQVDVGSPLVHHGGGSLGVGAYLAVAHDAGVVVAVAANGGDTVGLFGGYVDAILSELAGVTLTRTDPTPPSGAAGEPARHTGRYATRTGGREVTSDADGRLWLRGYSDAEAVTLNERAGVPAVAGEAVELRHHHDEVFALVAGDGAARVEFFGDDGAGRAGFLHSSGRAFPRVD